jgi:hypothetical protein
MTFDQASAVGLAGLTYLAGKEDAVAVFLRLSGLQPPDLRNRVDDPDLLLAVLEFLLTDDEIVMDFCRERDLSPRRIHLAQHVLETRQPST